MKTFILCGGKGTRLDHEGIIKPKALVKIGNEPIIIHLIKSLIIQGLNDFVLCMGYKKELIINLFLKNIKKYKAKILTKRKDYLKILITINKKEIMVHLINTKINSGTAGRIKIANNIIKNKDCFLMTYCDGLSNVNINKLIKFHRNEKKAVTVTAVQPNHRYGILKIKNKMVIGFNNQNPKQNVRINGGYFVINPIVLKIIKNNSWYWEKNPIEILIKKKQLSCYFHNDFWASLDTNKDKIYFNKMYKEQSRPWLDTYQST
jgi:glucose-1-phosphate cytidylyltransferase